jgi:hypothetical protein
LAAVSRSGSTSVAAIDNDTSSATTMVARFPGHLHLRPRLGEGRRRATIDSSSAGRGDVLAPAEARGDRGEQRQAGQADGVAGPPALQQDVCERQRGDDGQQPQAGRAGERHRTSRPCTTDPSAHGEEARQLRQPVLVGAHHRVRSAGADDRPVLLLRPGCGCGGVALTGAGAGPDVLGLSGLGVDEVQHADGRQRQLAPVDDPAPRRRRTGRRAPAAAAARSPGRRRGRSRRP